MTLLVLHIHPETKAAINASILQKQSATRPENHYMNTLLQQNKQEKVISLCFVFWGNLSSHSTDTSLLFSRIAT